MALTSDQQMGDIINQLHGMNSNQLQKIIKAAEDAIEKQKNNRKRELWGNVVATIRKYEQEIEPIMVLIPDKDDCTYITNPTMAGCLVTEY